jgi:hypothetical protein
MTVHVQIFFITYRLEQRIDLTIVEYFYNVKIAFKKFST